MDEDDGATQTGDAQKGGDGDTSENNQDAGNTVDKEGSRQENQADEGTSRQSEVDEEASDEQPVTSFHDEDSVSRDSSALRGDALGDESSRDQNEEASTEKPLDFVDEGQSMDAVSLRSEDNNAAGNNEAETQVIDDENTLSNTSMPTEKENEDVTGEVPDSNGSDMLKTSNDKPLERNNSKDLPPVTVDLEDDTARMDVSEQSDAQQTLMESLVANESMMDEDESEDLVAEVDISAMMEVNFDEGSENSQQQGRDYEPEVIPLDSDDDGDNDKAGGDSHPVVMNAEEAVYQIDDHENVLEVDVSNTVQMEVGDSNDSESITSRRPRRAAAAAAAKTIHQLSSDEIDVPQSTTRFRRSADEDKEFDLNEELYANTTTTISESSSQSQGPKQRCHVCLKMTPTGSGIVVRQYGADIQLCSNNCFNKFRNQGTGTRNKTLPCGKCGSMHSDSTSDAYFWETMNFCSDFCVGRYQMDVGCKCCTCGKNVSWNALGKYCVRFGSDIRQFCTPQCLDGYKKNARVCFHCQLDIRRSGNVILANIPSKTAPKEFCSNDCVELYCDRNMHQPTRAKPVPEHNCAICKMKRPVYRELALATGIFKSCSPACWQSLVLSKSITKAEKCEMCAKFVNMDLGFTTPVYWLSTMQRIYGFCSHVCKNLYILSSRKILACTTCKVKKYNFDLIEYYSNTTQRYAVCSLACLPKSTDYLKKIRDILFIPEPTSDKSISLVPSSFPVISSVSSVRVEENGRRGASRRKQQHAVTVDPSKEVIEIDDDDEDDSDTEIQIPDSDNIMDILTLEELEAVIKVLTNKKETRDVRCMAQPKTRTIETQTDISELNAMDRIPRVDDYLVPIPIPALMNIPFPGYFLESPCPVPFPVPIPVPILIPVIIPPKQTTATPTAEETRDDPDDDKDKDGKNPQPSTSTAVKETPPVVNTSNSTESTSNNNSSSTPGLSGASNCSTPVLHEYKIVPDLEIKSDHNRLNRSSRSNSSSIPLTPTPSVPSPDFSRRIGPAPSQSYPSPNYPQEGSYASSIYPSPMSSYSPTYASSPVHVPPLNPGAAVHPPPLINRSTPPGPCRDYGCPPSMGHQLPGCCGYDAPPPSRHYMPPAVPIIRPPMIPSVGSGYGTHSSSSMGYTNPPPSTMPITSFVPQPPAPKSLRVENALRAWKMMFGPGSDPRSLSSIELSSKLCDLINRGCKPNGERYRAELLLYISLGIQQLLRDNNRVDKIFYDNMYYNFVLAFTDRAERELTVGIHSRIEEIHFWETSELGASSPGVLLFTLIFLFYKHFGLKTWETHAALQFSNIVIQSKYDHYGRFVRYMTVSGIPGIIQTEVLENTSAPDRCILKVFEFYCFKSQIQNGPFYKCLRQDYTPRTPWFTSQPLDQRHIYQMLVRASMISNNNSDNFS